MLQMFQIDALSSRAGAALAGCLGQILEVFCVDLWGGTREVTIAMYLTST